jgi:hypothetical protein
VPFPVLQEGKVSVIKCFVGKLCWAHKGKGWESDLTVDGICFLIRMTHYIECLQLKTTIFRKYIYCQRLWAYNQIITQ